MRLVLGGPVIGGDSLSRFFTLHVFVIPGALLRLPGASPLAGAEARDQRAAPPRAGRSIPATYDAEYQEELKHGVPFLGDAMLKDVFFSALVVIAVVALAALIGPKGPTGPPDPDAAGREPPARVAVPLAVRPALAQPARAPRRSSSWSSRCS